MAHEETALSYLALRDMEMDGQFAANKIFAHPEVLHAWLHGSPAPPVTLELDISLVCNDRCPRCVHAFAHGGRHLPVEDVTRILDESAALGIPGLTLTGGGDPLCHPDFGRILEQIGRHDFFTGLITNAGLVVNDDIAKRMVDCFAWIRVSLDAASETTFKRVRGRGGLQRRIECLDRLVRSRNATSAECVLGLSFLTSASVADEIVPATMLASSLGFDYIQFKPMIEWRKGHHRSPSCDQSGVFEAIREAASRELGNFEVLFSAKKYEADTLGREVKYSAFHSAWFVISVGPNSAGSDVVPTYYLDCSSKYLPAWTFGQFPGVESFLTSPERWKLIESASSDAYCVPAEKHSSYNHLLEKVLSRHRQVPMGMPDLRSLAPRSVKHRFSV